MLKIALVGQKGGVGKTVVSQVLVNAALAKSEDIKVLLVETDEQGSSATYHLRATKRYPDLGARFHCTVCTDEMDLESILDQADADGFDYAIIDTAGSHKELSKYVLGEADKIIIPVRLLLNDWSDKTRMTVDQKNVLSAIFEEPHLADFFVPTRNGFDTLDQGYVIYRELLSDEVKSNPLVKKARMEELEIVSTTLKSIEAMQ